VLVPARECLPMRLPEARWDDELGELTPEHFLLRIAERVLGRDVELQDPAVVVDRDDCVERRVENRGCVRLAGAHARCAATPRTTVSDHCLLTIVPIGGRTDPRLG
jgi:hypothetical protein